MQRNEPCRTEPLRIECPRVFRSIMPVRLGGKRPTGAEMISYGGLIGLYSVVILWRSSDVMRNASIACSISRRPPLCVCSLIRALLNSPQRASENKV